MTPQLRRLLAFLSVALVVETSIYSTITPLLPDLVDDYGFSKAGAGILSAAYPIGTVLASLPAGALAARIGPQRTLLAALTTIAVASLGFAVADSASLLVAARALQGVGAAGAWAGALTWIMAVAPRERRVEAMGTAIGAAIAGALGGPVLGAIADATGREAVFAAFVALPAVLIVLLARLPRPRLEALPNEPRVLFRDPGVRQGVLLLAVPSAFFGTANVLVPLRLDELGVGAAAIAGVFLAATALESLLSPVSGRMADRHGPLHPSRRGLLLGAAGILPLSLLAFPVGVAVAVVVALGSLGLLWAPANAMLGDAAERLGLNPGFAFGLSNIAWGGGTAAGGALAGVVASATGDAVPYLLLAVGSTLIALRLGRRSGSRTSSRRRSSVSARSPGP